MSKKRIFKFDKTPCYYLYNSERKIVSIYYNERFVRVLNVDEEPLNDTPAFANVLHAIELSGMTSN